MNIEGQVALVTGGASGLGAETARELARRGAKVAVLDRNGEGAKNVAAEIVTRHGAGAAIGVACDIVSTDSVVAALLPFYGASCPAAVVARASWPDEVVVRAPLSELIAAMQATPIERTALILVGPALAAADFRESALYDADYVRRFRGGALGERS